jgi:hypothetical protein
MPFFSALVAGLQAVALAFSFRRCHPLPTAAPYVVSDAGNFHHAKTKTTSANARNEVGTRKK